GHAGQPQTVYYNFASIPDLDTTVRVELETWGFSPSVTFDLGRDWQARGFLNYGQSTTKTTDPRIDATALSANASNIDFYDIGATADTAILQQLITGNISHARGEDEIVNGRLVFDGPLITLPGGQLRAAVGVEYLGESYDVVQNNNADSQTRR